MKKLLTIMLAVLLAALAVAASAEDNVKNADIIIVGAGGGGLSAAIEAVNDGAQSVIVLEKTGKTGGSLNFTSGSMSGAETVIQKLDGIEDTKESFVQDILNNGAHLGNEAMIRAFVDEDVDAIQWLWDNGLSEYNFSSMKTTGKHTVFAPEHQLYSVARTYKPSANDPTRYKAAAHEIMDTVLATDAYKGVTIDFNTTANQLVANEQGQVLTVLATDENGQTVRYEAKKAVIMATGGYSGNSKMMSAFAENGANYLVGGRLRHLHDAAGRREHRPDGHELHSDLPDGSRDRAGHGRDRLFLHVEGGRHLRQSGGLPLRQRERRGRCGARDRAGRADQRDSVRHLHRQNHRGYRGAQRFRVLEFLLRAGQAV